MSGPLLGDRHLRPDPSGALRPIDQARKGLVRVTVPAPIASTIAGQHMIWTLTNQLVRQDRLVESIALSVPETRLLDGVVPYAKPGSLGESLLAWAKEAVGDRVRVELDIAADKRADVEITVGNEGARFAADRRLSIFADGWNIYAGPLGSAPSVIPRDNNPLGPAFAGCLAAAEVFKHLRGINPERGSFVDQLAYSLLDLQTRSGWEDLPSAELPETLSIGQPYLVGAGAVGQAFALALGSVPGVRGHVTAIDPEALDDITNLNRYPLARIVDFNDDRSKAEIVAQYLRSRGLTAHHVMKKWEEFLLRVDRGDQLPELASDEAIFRFDTILSCVDDTDGNFARHAIQNVWPRTLMGGSTHATGLRSSVSIYDVRSPWMCLKCHNRLRDPRKELVALVDELRRLSQVQRAAWTSARGMSADEVEEALSNPGCASVGIQQLADYVNWPGDPQLSVGFTSMAAGIILAAQLIKMSIGIASFPTDRGCSNFFYFLHPSSRWFVQGANPNCNCQTEGRSRHLRLWR